MPGFLRGVHPFALLAVAVAIFLLGLLGQGRGLIVKVLWIAAAVVGVVGALTEWFGSKK